MLCNEESPSGLAWWPQTLNTPQYAMVKELRKMSKRQAHQCRQV